MQIWRYVATVALFTVLAGCASTPRPNKNWTAAQYFQSGKLALRDGNYSHAQKMFQSLRGHFPFGDYARQAQLETILVYYRQNQPKSTIEAAQEFIKENPLSPEVAYAYYMEGLANFNHRSGIMNRLFPVAASRVDVRPLKKSFAAFKTLLEKYPHSIYALDARRRMIFLRNELAQHDIYVARFYMRKQAYVAVVNRCKNILHNYPGAQATSRALAMMIQAYDKLGLPGMASETQAVLTLNYPGYPHPH